MMPRAGYLMLAEQTRRLLAAKTPEERDAIRRVLPKLAIHFSGLTEEQQRIATLRCIHPSCFARPEMLGMECLAIIAEVRRGN